MIRLAAVVLSVVFSLLAVPAHAYRGGEVDVEVVTEHGEVFATIPVAGFEAGGTRVVKKYLEAVKGRNYSLVVRNNSSGRVGVVIAVDGRNIISGRKSHLRNDEEMYIISPFGSTRLDGWRTDDWTVHRFYFTSEADSYAKKTFDDASAMGVIAVAAFREREPYGYLREGSLQKLPAPGSPAPRAPMSGKDAAAGAPVQGSARKSRQEAGTGFGDEQYAPTVRVEFEPEQIPFIRTLIKYEWHETLCRKGILRCGSPVRNRLWDDGRYAPYPPGYPYPRRR